MADENTLTGLALRSLVTADAMLHLSLEDVATPEPGGDQIVVRVEAAPLNPSDLGLLIGPADMTAAQAAGTPDRPTLSAPIPAAAMPLLAARVGQPMPVGNEGAGTVVRAGPGAAHLMGRKVALLGGAMYAQYRLARAGECLVLPEGATAREGASAFVNPLTALSMVETMRAEGHKALVHTAAASNLGRMLVRICRDDNVPLVNIVRSEAQAEALLALGATHVLNSSDEDFRAKLTDALHQTGATLAFDAIGGGTLAGTILMCMEAAIARSATEYSRYGSPVHKQVYVYGMLDPAPISVGRGMGMAWGMGGYLLPYALMKLGPEAAARIRARAAAELTTTFASHYTAEITLAEALRPDVVDAYRRMATGEKYLVVPHGKEAAG